MEEARVGTLNIGISKNRRMLYFIQQGRKYSFWTFVKDFVFTECYKFTQSCDIVFT